MTTDLSQQMEQRNSRGAPSPEINLLLAAARAKVESEDQPKLPSLDGVNWEKLLDAAANHSLTSLLYRCLSVSRAGSVPPTILDALRQSSDGNLKHSLKLTGELWKILRLFDRHGIAAVPFKGPTLAALAYGDLASRQFADLDVLVDRTDIQRAGELLAQHGYQPEVRLDALGQKSFLLACTALSFRRPEIGCLFELHWALGPRLLPFNLGWGEILADVVPVRVGGQPMQTMSPEHLLIYLCAHGARHYWDRLGWVADIAWLIARHPQLNWTKALETARRLRSEPVLLSTLLLTRDLLGAKLPPAVEDRARADRTVRSLAAQITSRLLSPNPSEMGTLTRDLFYLQFHQSWREKLGYLWRLSVLPNMADWEFLPLPDSLTFLYPLIRLFRLAWFVATKSRKSVTPPEISVR